MTGGPCGGKTTLTAKIENVLGGKGFRMFVVPEAATIMMKSNCIIDHRLGSMSDDFNVSFATQLMNTQIQLENIVMRVAEAE